MMSSLYYHDSFIRFLICMMALQLAYSDAKCPDWYFYSNSSGRCECGHWLSCPWPNRARLPEGLCATTAHGEPGKYYIGSCPYSLMGNRSCQDPSSRNYIDMPDPDVLDEAMCGHYNRKGLLCGECKKGYGPALAPALTQFNLNCVRCSKNSFLNAVLLYIAFEVVPLTLIFISFILFRLDVTAGPLFGYFIFWQLIVSIIINNSVVEFMKSCTSSLYSTLLDIELITSQIITLNFLFVPFCVSEKFTEIHIQMIYLISAIYPVFLVIITCILMELHGRNFRVVHILWKPFGFILNKINISAGTGDAVIHAFASFIFLSYFSIYYTMEFVTTKQNIIRILTNETVSVLHIDPTITWLSQRQIMFALIAAIPFTILTLLPSLLLTVYPTRIYSRWLSHCISARKRLAVTAFTEALNKCFKDGLNGTRDWRSLPGLMPVFLITYIIFRDYIINNPHGSGVSAVLFFLFATSLVSYIKPCKSEIANFSFSFHLFLAGILSVVYHLWAAGFSFGTEWLIKWFILIPLLSNIFVITWIGYVIVNRLLKHFSYKTSLEDYKTVLIDFASCVKKLFYNRQSGYLPLD